MFGGSTILCVGAQNLLIYKTLSSLAPMICVAELSAGGLEPVSATSILAYFGTFLEPSIYTRHKSDEEMAAGLEPGHQSQQ